MSRKLDGLALFSALLLLEGLDQDGNLVDVRLSETRDMEGTKAFFAQVLELHEDPPEKVATDGLASYPRAIEEELLRRALSS